MIRDKEYDALKSEVSSMAPCKTPWLKPNFKVNVTMDSDSSCSDDEDEEMDISSNTSDVQSTSRKNVPITDEDGWTTVTSKRK